MGYYPPYFPDQSLQVMRVIPMQSPDTERIAPVSKKDMRNHLSRHQQEDMALKRMTGKGYYFDQYA